MAPNNGVVVTRGISAPASAPTVYEDTYDIVYYYPRFSLPSFDGFPQTILLIEIIVLTFLILGTGIFLIFFYISMNKYRCPRCKKQYCFKNEIPEYCTRCGAKLTLPKINLPE